MGESPRWVTLCASAGVGLACAYASYRASLASSMKASSASNAGFASRAAAPSSSSSSSGSAALREVRARCGAELDAPGSARRVAEALERECEAGLAQRPRTGDGCTRCSVKMLPSFVSRLPDGSERGVHYALDLGGTNLRVMRVALSDLPGRVDDVESREVAIPPALMCADATAEALFDFLARQVGAAIAEEGKGDGDDEEEDVSLGFTFSYPVAQTGIARGTLVQWTKGFATSGCVGAEVVQLLTEALRRAGLGRVRVAALVNDTVGTVAARAYADRTCEVGVILGTGTNAAYVERARAVPGARYAALGTTRPAGERADGVMVVNMEWGGFASFNPPCLAALPTVQADRDLDRESLNPGEQVFEKIVSGMYLGQCVRRTVLQVAEEGGFVGARMGPGAPVHAFSHMRAQAECIATADVAAMDADASPGLDAVREVLALKCGLAARPQDIDVRDAAVVQEVCKLFARRSAWLAAVATLCVARRIRPGLRVAGAARDGTVAAAPNDEDADAEEEEEWRGEASAPAPLTVAVDGGLYEHYPNYHGTATHLLLRLAGVSARAGPSPGGRFTYGGSAAQADHSPSVRFVHQNDGSGVGAALIAAACGTS